MKTPHTGCLNRSIIIALLLMLFPAIGFCQPSRKTTALVDEYILAAKNNTEKPNISSLLDNSKKHADILLVVEKYYSDTLYAGALEAYKLTYKVARKSNNAKIQQQAIEAITEGIYNSNRSVGAWCVRHLSVFARDGFSEKAKENIATGLQSGTPKLNELVKMTGYLNLSNQTEKIEGLAYATKKTSEKWAAWLALARMGEDRYINSVTEIVRRQGLNDDVVYELVPDLIYTRQKKVFELALEILYNDEKKCHSSSPDNPVRMECGYRVMEYLAPVIKDFPYGVKTSGDIDTDNYEKALTEVRKWFLEKDGKYEIIDESF